MERAGYSVRGQNARQSATRRCARSSSDNLPRTRRMFALAKTASLCTLAIDGTLRPAACQPARFKSNSVERPRVVTGAPTKSSSPNPARQPPA